MHGHGVLAAVQAGAGADEALQAVAHHATGHRRGFLGFEQYDGYLVVHGQPRSQGRGIPERLRLLVGDRLQVDAQLVACAAQVNAVKNFQGRVAGSARQFGAVVDHWIVVQRLHGGADQQLLLKVRQAVGTFADRAELVEQLQPHRCEPHRRAVVSRRRLILQIRVLAYMIEMHAKCLRLQLVWPLRSYVRGVPALPRRGIADMHGQQIDQRLGHQRDIQQRHVYSCPMPNRLVNRGPGAVRATATDARRALGGLTCAGWERGDSTTTEIRPITICGRCGVGGGLAGVDGVIGGASTSVNCGRRCVRFPSESARESVIVGLSGGHVRGRWSATGAASISEPSRSLRVVAAVGGFSAVFVGVC